MYQNIHRIYYSQTSVRNGVQSLTRFLVLSLQPELFRRIKLNSPLSYQLTGQTSIEELA